MKLPEIKHLIKSPTVFLSKANLLNNLQVLKSHAPQSQVIAMVKANAYGHGIVDVAKILENEVYSLGVARIDEGVKLREAGIKIPITLVEGIFAKEDMAVALKNNFDLVVHNLNQMKWLEELGTNSIRCWLKISTGMNRLGFNLSEGKKVYENLSKKFDIGVISHFACADEVDDQFNQIQIKNFEEFTKGLNCKKSFNNSAAIFNFPKAAYDVVRPGLALYGASPVNNKSASKLGLKPVMTFKTSLIAIHHLKAGDAVGYSRRYVCKSDMRIGVAAIGYGDGYSRTMQDGAPILVNGQKCSLAGRVSMDMITIDLSNFVDAKIGDEVVLWGEGLAIEEVLKYSDCSAYDLLCGTQDRVKMEWI